MSTIAIKRPNPTRNYNKNYNLGEFHDALPDLKLRDIHLLMFLLSLPAKWNLDKEFIAKKLKMGIWTVGDSLRNLVNAGIASYKRSGDGKVKWTLKLPDAIVTIIESDKKESKAIATESEPCSEFPSWEKPAWEIHTVLQTNNLLETNKKTTNAVEPEIELTPIAIIAAEIEAKIPTTLSKADKKAVKIQLAKLPNTELQLNVLIVLTAALAKNTVKNAVGYTNTLVKSALNGTLSTPKPTDKPLTPLEKEKLAKQKLFDFFNRNLVVLKREFLELKKDYVWVKGLGNITRDTFREFLAMTESATC